MKSVFLFTVGLILAVVLINPAIVSGQIIAPLTYSNLDLQITPDHVSVCPCVPITPQIVKITVKNLGTDAVIPKFELSGIPSGWTGEIQDYLDRALAPGEEGTVSLLLINPPGCDVAPGIYDTIKIKAVGLTAGDYDEESLVVEIMECYGVELTVSPDYQETCTESGEEVSYSLSVKNLGKNPDTFDFTASVAWARFSESPVELGPGETKDVELILEPAEGLSGLQTVSLTAKSQTSYAQDSKEVKLQINDCYVFETLLQPLENTVCLGQSVEYILVLRNTGLNSDTYSIYAPSWVTVSENDVSIPAGEAVEITVTVTPEQTGRMPLELTVASSADPDDAKIVSGFVNTNECRAVAVILSPSQGTVCQGRDAEFTVSIKNLGVTEDTFDLTASMGSLGQNKVIISAGGTKDLVLTIDTSELGQGEHSISVTASDGIVSDTGDVTLIVQDCYSATLDFVPAEQEKCVCEIASYNIILENTGEMPDTYDVSFTSEIHEEETEVQLDPGQSTTIPVDINTLGVEAGEYLLTANADSEHVSLTATAQLSVKAHDICYSMIMTTEDETKVIEACTAETVPIKIKNTGEKAGTFQIAYEGPEWIYVSPDSMELESGEEKEIYLYISPPYEITEGYYTASISAASEQSRSSLDINITIVPASEAVGNETGEPGNETGTGITINVTTNITGLITGEDERPLWKTVVVAIITIIIIIILVVRFVLLVRK